MCSKGDRTCEQNMAALQCFTTITTTSYTHPRRFFPCCAAKQKQTTGFPISLSRWLFVAEIYISYYTRLSVIHQIMIFGGKFKDAKFHRRAENELTTFAAGLKAINVVNIKWDILFDNHQLLRNEPTPSLYPSIVNPLNLLNLWIFFTTHYGIL